MSEHDEVIAIFNLHPSTLSLETQDYWLSILCRYFFICLLFNVVAVVVLYRYNLYKETTGDFEAMHLKNWIRRQQSSMHVLRSLKEDVVHFGSFQKFPELFSIVKSKHLAALAEALRSHERLHVRMLVTTLLKLVR